MKFAFVAAEKARGEFKVTELCRALRVSTSGFYAWCKREPSTRSKKDEQLKVLIKASFDESRKTYGSPRIHEDLLEAGEKIGRNRVIRLMQTEGLEARARKRFKCTTISDHDQPRVNRSREGAAVRLHRGLLQPAPAALDTRLRETGAIRA